MRKIDASQTITTYASPLSNPNGVWVDPNGNLFIVDADNHVIRKVDPGGTITTFAGNGVPGRGGDEGPATSAQMQPAYGVVADGQGNVYVSDSLNDIIRYVDPAGIIHTIAGNGSTAFATGPVAALSAGLTQPTFAYLDTAGHIYLSVQNQAVYELYH